MRILEETFNVKFINHFRPELFSQRSGLTIDDLVEVFSFPTVSYSIKHIYNKADLGENIDDINFEALIFFMTVMYTYIIRKAPYVPDEELVDISVVGHTRLDGSDSIKVKYTYQ